MGYKNVNPVFIPYILFHVHILQNSICAWCVRRVCNASANFAKSSSLARVRTTQRERSLLFPFQHTQKFKVTWKRRVLYRRRARVIFHACGQKSKAEQQISQRCCPTAAVPNSVLRVAPEGCSLLGLISRGGAHTRVSNDDKRESGGARRGKSTYIFSFYQDESAVRQTKLHLSQYTYNIYIPTQFCVAVSQQSQHTEVGRFCRRTNLTQKPVLHLAMVRISFKGFHKSYPTQGCKTLVNFFPSDFLSAQLLKWWFINFAQLVRTHLFAICFLLRIKPVQFVCFFPVFPLFIDELETFSQNFPILIFTRTFCSSPDKSINY